MEDNELSVRLFNFATNVIIFLRTLENNIETRVIKYQLIKASSSTGANIHPVKYDE